MLSCMSASLPKLELSMTISVSDTDTAVLSSPLSQSDPLSILINTAHCDWTALLMVTQCLVEVGGCEVI